MSHKITREQLENSVREYLTAMDTTQTHLHLRVYGDGNIGVFENASYTIPISEHNREDGHPVTLDHAQGSGGFCYQDGEADLDADIETYIDNLIERGEMDGVEIIG